jgi:intracellular septation protein A
MNNPSHSISSKWFLSRALISVGKVFTRLASMMSRGSSVLFRNPNSIEAITKVAGVLIVATPFVYSFFQFRHRGLECIPNCDSFAYLWSGPLSVYFVTGRSLLQRTVFYLLSNNTSHIHIVQHLLFAATAFLWLWALRPASKLQYLTVSLLIAWVAGSTYLSHQSSFISADPIYLAFLFIFPATVVSASRGSGGGVGTAPCCRRESLRYSQRTRHHCTWSACCC